MKKIVSRVLSCILVLLLLASMGSVFAASGFSDVSPGCWYEAAVNWAVSQNVTAGVGNGKFGPNQTVTRAQVVTMLWRLANSPEPAGAAAFSDVAADRWYSKAIAWAAEAHIVSGYPSGRFAPNKGITREDLVTILYSFACD